MLQLEDLTWTIVKISLFGQNDYRREILSAIAVNSSNTPALKLFSPQRIVTVRSTFFAGRGNLLAGVEIASPKNGPQ